MSEDLDQAPSKAARGLLHVVSSTIGCPVMGEPARRIAALLDGRPELLAELTKAALGLRGIVTATGAAAALESAAAGVTAPAAEPADPRARREVVRRLIATLEAVDPDSGHLGQLHDEYRSLTAVTGEG